MNTWWFPCLMHELSAVIALSRSLDHILIKNDVYLVTPTLLIKLLLMQLLLLHSLQVYGFITEFWVWILQKYWKIRRCCTYSIYGAYCKILKILEQCLQPILLIFSINTPNFQYSAWIFSNFQYLTKTSIYNVYTKLPNFSVFSKFYQ